MPKIVGLAVFLFALAMLVRTMHEALTFFSAHGATSTELWASTATLLGAGALTIFMGWVLWC